MSFTGWGRGRRGLRGAAAALLALAAIGAGPGSASAHQPDDPDAHRSMPNQVTAGVVALCPSYLHGEHADLRSESGAAAGDLDARVLPCVGAAISFARELGRSFELRVRAGYEKPFAIDGDTELAFELHQVRATLAPSFVAYRMHDKLTLTVGGEVGFAASILTASDELAVDAATGYGVYAGVVAAVRPWVTYHTGFFAELSAGASAVWSDDFDLTQTTLGRVTLGWADRF